MSTAVTKNSQNCLSQQSVILSVKCYWSLKIILTTLLTSLPGNLSALWQKIVLQSCTCLYIWFCYQDCYLLWFVGHVTGRDVIVVVTKRWHTDETCIIIIIIIIIIITTSRLQHNSNLLHSQQCITHKLFCREFTSASKCAKFGIVYNINQILSRPRLKTQRDIWTLKQVWWSWVHAHLRTFYQSCPTPKIARQKRAKSSVTQQWIIRFAF